MKLILKNLKQVQYNVEVESEKSTVKDLKNEIEKEHGFDSNLIKLLHNGKVLEDSKTLEDYQIKDEYVIIMMNTKPKAKPNPPPAEQPKPEPQKVEEQPKKEEEKPKQDFSQQINSLVDMGYEREKVEKAINASKGNIDLAIEYLSSGNIPDSAPNNQQNQQSQQNPPSSTQTRLPNIPDSAPNNQQNQQSQQNPPSSTQTRLPLELRRNASLMKIICRNDPERIYNILNSLKMKNPALLNKIKEHETEFKNLLVSPITQEDIDTFKLLENDIRGLGGEGGRRPGQVEIRKD